MIKNIINHTVSALSTIIIFIIVLGFVFFFFGLQSPEPEFSEKEFTSANWDIEIDKYQPQESDIGSELTIDQESYLRKQQLILSELEIEIKKIIDNEIKRISEKYQKIIDEEEEKLNQMLNNNINQIKTEKEARYLEKQNYYSEKLEEYAEKIKEEELAQLDYYESDLIREYFSQKINLDLKLKFHELTQTDESLVRQELEEINYIIEEKFQKKEKELLEIAQEKIIIQEEKYQEKLNNYQEQLLAEKERKIERKRAEYNEKMIQFANTKQKLMEEEIRKRKQELLDRSQIPVGLYNDIINKLVPYYK